MNLDGVEIEDITVALTECPRCGGNHTIVFHPLSNPIMEEPRQDGTEAEFTHYAECPTNGHPLVAKPWVGSLR